MDTLENNTVQEKIKRLIREKKLAKEAQSVQSGRKRIISQTAIDNNHKESVKQQTQSGDLSKRSQLTKRDNQSLRLWDVESNETSSQYKGNNNNRVDLQRVVNNIFTHSPKIEQYLQQYSLRKQDALREVLTNDLFVLSLGSKIYKLSKHKDGNNGTSSTGDLNGMVENEVILKLTKLHKKKKQSLSIYGIENRINTLITNRLETLRKY